MWMIISGRCVCPSASVTTTWVSKSTCSNRPADSTMLRSCASPHAPRTLLLRNADDRALVSRSNRACCSPRPLSCSPSAPISCLRPSSICATFACNASRFFCTGANADSTLLCSCSFFSPSACRRSASSAARRRSRSTRISSARWACANCDLRYVSCWPSPSACVRYCTTAALSSLIP